jgi:hypothetical protein
MQDFLNYSAVCVQAAKSGVNTSYMDKGPAA